MKTEHEKCAEVFRNGPGRFTFYCTYCTEQFDMHYDALDHIEQHFSVDKFEDNVHFKTNSTEIEPENLFNIQTESAVFVPESKETGIESIVNDGNETKIFVIQNDFVQQSILDPFSNNSESDYLNEIKVEPADIKTIIETAPIENLITQCKKYTRASKYAKFGHIAQKMLVECDKCHRRVQKHCFVRHFRTHINPKPKKNNNRHITFGYIAGKNLVECDKCHNQVQKEYFVRHFQIHTNPKSFVCSTCKKRFNTKHNLERHILRVHSEESKKYCCQYCSHRFYEHSNLKQHIRIHTGEKPFKCEICGRGFSQSSGAKIHMRVHTNEKPYQCEICNKAFGTNSSYWLHRRRHKDVVKVKCNTCEKEFSSKQDLMRHNMIHTGERPFSCEVCNATFKTRYTYNQHLLTHTDKKPYKCRFCHLNFTLCHARRLHERTVHNDIKRCEKIS